MSSDIEMNEQMSTNFDMLCYFNKCQLIYIWNVSSPNERRRKKTGLRVFPTGQTKAGLYSHRRWLKAGNFGIRKKRDCTICVVKTKALISFAAHANLICVFLHMQEAGFLMTCLI